MKRLLLAAALALLAGCPAAVDTTGLPSADGYRDWPDPLTVTSKVPGHGDTVRIIYVNDVAREYSHGGDYPFGSVLVKEIYNRGDGYGGQGSLKYVALMRRVGVDNPDVPADLVDGGWVFSETDAPGGDEKRVDLCWAKCHREAPYHGAWLDYGY